MGSSCFRPKVPPPPCCAPCVRCCRRAHRCCRWAASMPATCSPGWMRGRPGSGWDRPFISRETAPPRCGPRPRSCWQPCLPPVNAPSSCFAESEQIYCLARGLCLICCKVIKGNAMAQVSIRNVTKAYDANLQVVKGIDLEIANEEFVVLVGPSGCGKTTALRMVAGLEEITSGEIRVGGQVVNDLEPPDRDIAMVFQNYALYPHMSVEDNIGFPLRMQRMKKAEMRGRVREVADLLGIEDLLGRK